MSSEEISVRDRIVLAAINCIEKQGIGSVTVRSIAKEAGVNSAAINYYFRSKDLLIEEAIKVSLHHAFSDWERFLNDPDIDSKARFRGFLADFLEGAIRFPGMTKAYLFDPLMKNRYENQFVTRFNALLGRFMEGLKAVKPLASEKEIQFTVIQLISALTFAALIPDFFLDYMGNSFNDPETRKEYVNFLLGQNL
jgi:AcrR family transcriptional regulator